MPTWKDQNYDHQMKELIPSYSSIRTAISTCLLFGLVVPPLVILVSVFAPKALFMGVIIEFILTLKLGSLIFYYIDKTVISIGLILMASIFTIIMIFRFTAICLSPKILKANWEFTRLNSFSPLLICTVGILLIFVYTMYYYVACFSTILLVKVQINGWSAKLPFWAGTMLLIGFSISAFWTWLVTIKGINLILNGIEINYCLMNNQSAPISRNSVPLKMNKTPTSESI